MPKYLVEMDGKKYNFEGDHPPSEEEARQAIGETSSITPQQIESPIVDDKPSPLNPVQNLILGTMPEENKIPYLQKEFEGRNVQFNPDSGITVDGAPVNPKGFDAGDILRSVGYAIPFAAQVAGSMAGATVGIPAGPLGIAAGAVSGGVAGATAGEAIRIGSGKLLLEGLGKHLDLSDEGKTFINSLADTAKGAAVGEALGLGIGSGVSALTKTQLYKGASDAWSKTVDKLKNSDAPISDVLKFVGNIDKDATRVVLRDKPSVVLNEQYFDPNKTSKIASKTLFGTEDFTSLGITNKDGVEKGTIALAKSIKDIDEPAYDHLLSSFGVDKELINGIRASNVDEVLSSINTNNPRRATELAMRSIKEIQDQEKSLGEELFKSEIKAIKEKSNVHIYTGDISKEIDTILGKGSLLKDIKVPGFVTKPAMKFAGSDKLEELGNILKGVNKSTGEKQAYGYIPTKQLFNIKKQFDAKVDEIFLNQNIQPEIKDQVSKIAKVFRSKYYDTLGISNETKAYSIFKDMTDSVIINGKNARYALENKINNFKSLTGAEQDDFVKAMSSTKNGSSIIKEINDYGLSKSIRNINTEKMLKGLSAPLSTKSFLSSNTTDSTTEGILRDISNRLLTSTNKNISNRAFAIDAERALASKAFLANNQNLLRLQTLTGMLGVGGLISGGPMGGAVGAGLALSFANPQNLGKMLIKAETISPSLKAANDKFGQSLAVTERKKALLRAIMSSSIKENNEKRRHPNLNKK